MLSKEECIAICRAAKCVYLACEASVADDISAKLLSSIAALEEAEADRDKWKARAQALERAVKEYDVILCDICVSKDGICEGCMKPHSKWQFDESRFAGGDMQDGAEGEE